MDDNNRSQFHWRYLTNIDGSSSNSVVLFYQGCAYVFEKVEDMYKYLGERLLSDGC